MIDTPLTLPNGTTLPNRIAKSAMEEDLAELGQPTQRHVSAYQRWARGGAGLLITGNVVVDRNAPTDSRVVVIEDERSLPILRDWARAAKSGGSVALMQINHPGRQIPKFLSQQPVSASAVGVEVPGARGLFRVPRAMSEAEIQATIQRFARAARIAVEAGFDGVQVHAAHGYLVSQFLSPLTNQRSDAWGGAIENRARFLLEVVRAMRAAVPADRVLAIKLNSADFQKGGFDEEDACWVIERLNEEGIDLLELSGGTYEAPAMLGPKRASSVAREAYFLDFAEKARAIAKMPILVTGGFRSRAGIEAALASGAIDIAGLAKPFCVEPDLPRKMIAGELDHVAWPVRDLSNQAANSLAHMGWARYQIHRLADGGEPRLARGTITNLVLDFLATQYQAWRYRRWLSKQRELPVPDRLIEREPVTD